MKKVTVLDLGSDKIIAASAVVTKSGEISSLVMESLYSQGISEGEIKDREKATEDIKTVLKKLENQGGMKAKEIFVITRSSDVTMVLSRGMAALAALPREITAKDMKRCVEVAALLKLSHDRIIIDKIAKNFYIDGEGAAVRNPLGLYGKRLEVEAYIATMDRVKIENLSKCLDDAGFFLNGVYLSGLVTAEVVLDKAERIKGALLLYVGESITEEIVFKNDALEHYHVIKRGKGSFVNKNGMIKREELTFLLKEAVSALGERMDDFHSAVVTGAGGLVDGVIEEAESVLKTEARIGLVKRPSYNLNAQNAIIHTSTIGLLERIADEYKLYNSQKNLAQKVMYRIREVYENYF